MQNQRKKKLPDSQSLRNYARYSALAGQMLGTMLLGTALGWYIDQQLGNTLRIGTLVGVVLSVLLAMYVALKDLMQKNNKP